MMIRAARSKNVAVVRRRPSRRLSSAAAAAAAASTGVTKLLVANRGEIACRVFATARRMGIPSVAVYSSPDASSKHVQMADESRHVGPAASSESYLAMDRILEACVETGADAVHPGYGFLSENTKFCDLLEKHGVTFVGPKQHALEVMGAKIASKRIATEAGVNVVPGFVGEVRDEAHMLEIAREIGYPVMIKASAGGGGKGMRVAYNDTEAREGYHLSIQEARASFGDDAMLVEKFVEEPRHIEIQVLADSHGNAVYLNERECSIQRRNQKVVEEAPSPFLSLHPDVRKAMGEQAVALARAVDYQSAGTVEFLVDKDANFFFLEMNTRLQVEHPITEYITQVDLVEQMIRVARGEPLTVTQADVDARLERCGWAIESRVYAEDPLRGFLPSVGRLHTYREPQPNERDESDVRVDKTDVRCDTGVWEGSEITTSYDPLICKLTVHGDTRDAAVAKMRRALDTYVIRGVSHNIPFLRAVMDNPAFVRGDTTTEFIPREFPRGFEGATLAGPDLRALVASAVLVHGAALDREATLRAGGQTASFAAAAFERELAAFRELVVTVGADGGPEYEVALAGFDELPEETGVQYGMCLEVRRVDAAAPADEREPHTVTIGSDYQPGEILCDVHVADGAAAAGTAAAVNTEAVQVVAVNERAFEVGLVFRGSNHTVTVRTPEQDRLLKLMPAEETVDHSLSVLSPMPGAVVEVCVKAGDEVTVGAELITLEAMKMQNSIKADRNGVIKSVLVGAGDNVASDQVMITYEA